MQANKLHLWNKNTFIPGSFIAFILSYSINQSIFMGLLSMLAGWFYVLYWMLSYTDICAYVRSWVVT